MPGINSGATILDGLLKVNHIQPQKGSSPHGSTESERSCPGHLLVWPKSYVNLHDTHNLHEYECVYYYYFEYNVHNNVLLLTSHQTKAPYFNRRAARRRVTANSMYVDNGIRSMSTTSCAHATIPHVHRGILSVKYA